MGNKKFWGLGLVLSVSILMFFQSCGSGQFVASGNGDPYEGISVETNEPVVINIDRDVKDPDPDPGFVRPNQQQNNLPLSNIQYQCEFRDEDIREILFGTQGAADKTYIYVQNSGLVISDWDPAFAVTDIYTPASENILIEFVRLDSENKQVVVQFNENGRTRSISTTCSQP